MEHKQKNKSNLLLDRRFGEGEEDLSVEEKVMQRFILERKVSGCVSAPSCGNSVPCAA